MPRGRQQKAEQLLEKAILPANQFTLACKQIDRESIVFDGCDPNSPPIKPPDGVRWRSFSVSSFHIQDSIQPNLGMTAPRMVDQMLPFI
jgi:hypothetical protein